MNATLVCTGRGTHDPVTLYIYDGEIPVPDWWRVSARSSVFELVCRSRLGGCGYAPRPSDAAMRALIAAAAGHPSKVLDVSYSGL
jgi:hypothetical protein